MIIGDDFLRRDQYSEDRKDLMISSANFDIFFPPVAMNGDSINFDHRKKAKNLLEETKKIHFAKRCS